MDIQGSGASRSINLKKGWNLVGYNALGPAPVDRVFHSVADQLEVVWTYRGVWKMYRPGSFLNDLETVTPGLGHWIKVKKDCTWTLP